MFNKSAFKKIPLPRVRNVVRGDLSIKGKVKDCAQYTAISAASMLEATFATVTLGTCVWRLRDWAMYDLVQEQEPYIVRLVNEMEGQ